MNTPIGFSDVGMNDAVFEILDVDHRRLVRFLPTDQEDTWPDECDRNLNGLRGSLEETLDVRERHHRLGCEVEMEDPATEMRFVHVADSWKVRSRHELLLLAITFEKVQKIILLWKSQREAYSLRGETHPYLVFCSDALRGVFISNDHQSQCNNLGQHSQVARCMRNNFLESGSDVEDHHEGQRVAQVVYQHHPARPPPKSTSLLYIHTA